MKHDYTMKDGKTSVPYTVENTDAQIPPIYDYYAAVEALRKRRPTFREVLDIKQRRDANASLFDAYSIQYPAELLAAAERYYNEKAPLIVEALEKGGADDMIINAVLFDYAAALCAFNTFSSTIETMEAALSALTPAQAFILDKYGLYVNVVSRYKRNIELYNEYKHRVKDADGVVDRALFFDGEAAGKCTDFRAASLFWLQSYGEITANDFRGIPPTTTAAFLDYIRDFGLNAYYIYSTFTARYVLAADDTQVQSIDASPLFYQNPADARTYADKMIDEIKVHLQNVELELAAVFNTSTPEETTQAKNKVETAAGATIDVPPTITTILSRDVWGSASGANAQNILPISVFIDDFLEHHKDALPVSGLIIKNAIEGADALRRLKRPREIDKKRYSIDTNLSEFSGLCGYKDANEEEKKQLFTALRILSNLYVVVWDAAGRFALQLLNIPEYGISGKYKEKLTIELHAEAFKGRPKLITVGELLAMKKAEKGAAAMNFRYQILNGEHKAEETLLNQVFGYDTKIFEATGNTGDETVNPEGVAGARRLIQKHKPRDRKKLKQMFDDYAANDWIKYQRYTNKKGEIIYKWQRLNVPADDSQPTQEPDEQ